MDQYMDYIVLDEKKPFCFIDFQHFYLNGKEHGMAHGTFRNKISKLIKNGRVIRDYYSSCAFYTLPGHRFGKNKSMTRNHMGVTARSRRSNWIYDIIDNLPLSKNSLHDIRLCFKFPDLWSILSSNSSLSMNLRSKDIHLPAIIVDDLHVETIVHRTNSVSVSVACSYAPIVINIGGVIRLSNALTRVEDMLLRIIDSSGAIIGSENKVRIPPHMDWSVKMWHFGADGAVEIF